MKKCSPKCNTKHLPKQDSLHRNSGKGPKLLNYLANLPIRIIKAIIGTTTIKYTEEETKDGTKREFTYRKEH